MDAFDQKEKLLKSNHKALQVISGASYQLMSLAKSFRRIGNHAVDDELCVLANEIADAADLIRGNQSEEININFQQAQQNSANMLSAVVAGLEIQKHQQ